MANNGSGLVRIAFCQFADPVHGLRVDLALDLGDVDRGTGVGLGLAVARGFVAAMGGELELEDTPGGGTTAIVTLKAAP